jgi:hypothetical protein
MKKGLLARVQQAEFSYGPWLINHWATGQPPTSIPAPVIDAGSPAKEEQSGRGKKKQQKRGRKTEKIERYPVNWYHFLFFSLPPRVVVEIIPFGPIS